MSKGIELRKHPRVGPLIIRTQYQYSAGSGEGYLLNLSRGGAFLATREPLPIDEKVQLVVSLPWEIGVIHAESKVRWRSEMIFDTDRELTPGAGLEFTNMSTEDRERLEAFMQKFNRLADQINEED
jgi:uncharacterized protein (TIGR02266 family)